MKKKPQTMSVCSHAIPAIKRIAKNTTKYHTIKRVPKSNRKIVERGKLNNTPNTQINDRSLSWLGTCTSIKSGCVKLVLWAKISLINDKCFVMLRRLTLVVV